MGTNNRKFARFTHVATGHFPCGEFRRWFNLEGPTVCGCGAAWDDRVHMLHDCLLWICLWAVEPDWLDAYTFMIDRHGRTGVLDGIKNELPLTPILAALPPGKHINKVSMSADDLLDFLRYNPIVATFEWSDLVDEVLLYREAELPLNVHEARFLAHTVVCNDVFFQVHPGRDALAFVADYQPKVVACEIYRCFLRFAKKPITDPKCFAPLESVQVTEVTRWALRALHRFDNEYVVSGTVPCLCYVPPRPLRS